MQPIQHLLNKIKWDKREDPEEYSIFYFDRILKKLIKIPYHKIKRIEGSFMILDRLSSHESKSGGKTNPEKMGGEKVSEHFDNEEESNIPLHRIKKVEKNNIVVWERKL